MARKKSRMQWFRVDLHLHTPASADYQEPHISYLDMLRKAEFRGLDIIAFTDHNTVSGYAAMMREIEQLTFLEQMGRAQPDELRTLQEYRRLLDKVLVLPGFEFTATFGFHILGIFSPQTPLRQVEHLLLSLNVPPAVLDEGNSEVGASSDVLTAYNMINGAGGICIAAHANSAHGVAMRGFDFGGQTKIAYTQDRNLHALEVTDLERKGRMSTERFFNGTKSAYPRRMRCIQGSDAHRINAVTDKGGKYTHQGIGDRVTEVLLAERSFESLLEMFQGADFSRSRPYTAAKNPYDYIQVAREEGETLVQSFHEQMTRHGGRLYAIIADVCAFANTNGGTVYVGLSSSTKKNPIGIEKPAESVEQLQSEIARMISPTLDVEVDVQETGGKPIIRIQVPSGDERPYAIDDNKIYVRDEADTSLAVRDEIVSLVKHGLENSSDVETETPTPPALPESPTAVVADSEPPGIAPPTAGVEIIGSEQRGDTRYYIMRDLRNGNIVKNVTRSSARRLWGYAIKQHAGNPVKADKVEWRGEIGLWSRYERGGTIRYDLVQKDNGKIRVYYGVTDSGMQGPWQAFLAPEDDD
ncbi:MAG: putative DNA binding domain-containing protein [Anaerolineaceae bacterium]|nr:putative DNA binding domain-containing protein [Anaerolineaceae bacterium]